MTDELIGRVRDADPLPEGSVAPPFELVYAEHRVVVRRGGRDWGKRTLGLLAPALVVAMSLGAIVVAVVLVRARPAVRTHRGPVASGQHRSTTRPAATPTIPSGGMSGHVTVHGAGFNSQGAGVISVEQCLRCQANGNPTARATFHDWLVTTADGGSSWTLSATDYYLQDPLLRGRDGWAGGLVLLTRKQGAGPAGWKPGVGTARYLHSGDNGRSWTVAPSAAPNLGGSATSLAGDEVWAFGLDANATVLHGQVGGARLSATAAQPLINGYDTNTHVAAAGAQTAYVINANLPRQSYVTHDDGRSWQQLTRPPCNGPYAAADLDAASGQTVWITCVDGHLRKPTLLRSLDGGHSWERLAIQLGNDSFESFVATSAEDAWVMDSAQTLLRTTDAGATWTPVWSADNTRVSPLSRPIGQVDIAPFPILSVQSSDSASIVTLLNRGTTQRQAKLTNLAVYRTTDGGQSWSPHVVPLAPRSRRSGR
jgi:photosystem II stability/assembly factor-like uncharacterized protein